MGGLTNGWLSTQPTSWPLAQGIKSLDGEFGTVIPKAASVFRGFDNQVFPTSMPSWTGLTELTSAGKGIDAEIGTAVPRFTGLADSGLSHLTSAGKGLDSEFATAAPRFVGEAQSVAGKFDGEFGTVIPRWSGALLSERPTGWPMAGDWTRPTGWPIAGGVKEVVGGIKGVDSLVPTAWPLATGVDSLLDEQKVLPTTWPVLNKYENGIAALLGRK